MTLLKDQEHMATSRKDGMIIKTAKNAEGILHLSNEKTFLEMMAPTGYVPKLIGGTGPLEAPTSLALEDLGDGEDVTDTDALLTHAIHLLGWLASFRVHHGDLTAPNIIIKNNKPMAIDFSESIDLDAPPTREPKRSEPDWFHLLQVVEAHGDPRRIIRRWLAIRDSLGVGHDLHHKSLVDFGCNEGYMVALAAANRANALGLDIDNSVCRAAYKRWAELPMSPEDKSGLAFLSEDMTGLPGYGGEHHFALCLSVYPYLIQQVGEEQARFILATMVKAFDMVFFEAQSSGDGPGPSFWPDQKAVGEYLTVFGHVREVCRLDIPGRQAERVTWLVTKN